MKVEYIESFFEATKGVFQLMIGLEPKAGKPSLKGMENGDYLLGVLLKIHGDLSGFVYYTFPKKTTMSIVKAMSGMELEELDNFVSSAIGELVNIISGNATTLLAEEGYVCDISTPSLVVEDIDQAIDEDLPLVSLPLTTDIGDLNMNIYIS